MTKTPPTTELFTVAEIHFICSAFAPGVSALEPAYTTDVAAIDFGSALETGFVCLADGCATSIPWRRGHCKAHGGTKRCSHTGCPRGPQKGGFCIAHGGGRRCSMDGCNKAVQTLGLCKAHGGGIRCGADGCDKSSQGGGYCRNTVAASARGQFCAKHGGFRHCHVAGCPRTDRGGGLCDTHRIQTKSSTHDMSVLHI
ncbi:hypothetical protein SPRG_13401 [Saprolegnia parasitica CBS 223.65]|uniref:WRKY19-like zinc finger domain-containing protein n=1 Tax=Saprolegnia parasitica (strain CBS 223.65) TaxID=695850 RepID=A0A067BQW4_SAPPC|nr:hypothetical protein SPRG_13401 [Saprolegnia parasitica CBS 223.65]KDO20648.1 hypothetical protein SPRG_13401 [Saprolegnia parasitica CBS 223.65]|eukprot:XP_012208614.1 hypothetical protein SPRG_13401 [Saprolegnia parasitica CBS 223.65]